MPPKRAASTGRGSAKSAGKRPSPTRKASKKAKATPVKEAAAPPEIVDGCAVWLATDALQKTKAMSNYFQLERDRIVSFWDLSKKQLEDVKEKLREKEQCKAELEDRHDIVKKVFKQKIRHLLYEHQLQLSSAKEEAERSLMAKEEEYRQLENSRRRNIRDAKLFDREIEIRHREQRQALVAQQDKEITEQQMQFERELKEIHLKYEQMIKSVREDLDQSRREEIRELEKRKEQHVVELRNMHERTFKEIRDYYSEITSNNLETIRTLKDEVYARKRTEAHNEKAMYEVAQRNKKLTEPLAHLQRQKKDLELELANYLSDKAKLQNLKASVKETEQDYQTLSWEHEVLLQRYTKLVEDRDIILNKYNRMLQDIQRKSTFRRVLLQKKIELVQSQLEGRDATLTELLKRANVNAEDIKELEQKVHDLLSEKDKTIEDLKQLLTRMSERHEDISRTYASYLESNGVSSLSATAGRS